MPHLWLLPWSALGMQCQYPSRTPWYSASRCVFCVLKVWWDVARMHSISLQTVNSPYLCPTRWRRTACMVGHCIRITPDFFCCHQVYSVVKRDLSQCSGSSTRAPHWQFLLENRDEKSSGSGSQNQGTLTFHASW